MRKYIKIDAAIAFEDSNIKRTKIYLDDIVNIFPVKLLPEDLPKKVSRDCITILVAGGGAYVTELSELALHQKIQKVLNNYRGYPLMNNKGNTAMRFTDTGGIVK